MNRNGRGALVPSLFVALVLLSVIGSRITVGRLENRLGQLRDEGSAAVYREFGAAVSWESISPTIVRGVSMSGVRIEGVGVAERVQVRVRLVDILRGRLVDAIPEILIVRPQITIDSVENREALDHLIETIGARDTIALETTIIVRNGAIRYSGDDWAATLERISVEMALSQDEITLSSRFEAGYTRETADTPFTLATDVSTELSGSRARGSYRGTLDLGRVTGSHLAAEGQSVFFSYGDGRAHIERIRSRDPLDLAATIDTELGTTEIAVRSSSFRLAEILELRGPWADYQRFLGLEVTSVGEVTIGEGGAVQWAGGTITTRLDLEELPEAIAVDGEFEYADGVVRIPHSRFRPSNGSAYFTGEWDLSEIAPSGVLDLQSFSYAGSPQLYGTVALLADTDSFQATAGTLHAGSLQLHSVDLDVTRSGEFFDTAFSASGSEDTEGEIRGRLRIASSENLTGEITLVGLNVETAVAAGEVFGRSIDLPSGASGLSISGTARFDRRGDAYSVYVPNLVLVDPESDLLVRLGGRYSEGAVVLEHYFIRGSGVTAIGEALIAIGSGGTIDFETDFSVNRIEYSLRGLIDTDGNVVVLGPYGVEARIRRTRAGGLRLLAGIDALPLPIGRSVLSTRLEGLFLDSDDWYIGFTEIRINDLPVPGGRAVSLLFAATLEPDSLSIALLDTGELFGSIAGTVDIEYRLGATISATLDGRFGSLEGAEQYRITSRYDDRRFAVDLRVLNSPVSRVAPRIREGTVSGTIQAAGTIDDPQVRAYFESSGIRSGDREIEFQLFAYGDSQELRIARSEMRFGALETTIEEIRIDRLAGSITGDLVLDDRTRGRVDTVHIVGTTEPIPDLSIPVLRSLPVHGRIEAVPSTGDRDRHLYTVDRRAGTTSVRREDEAIVGYIEDAGSFEIRTTAPVPIAMHAAGRLARGEVDLTASGVEIDLARGIEAIAIPGLERVTGTARGAVRVIGRTGDPDIYGTLRIDNFATTTSFSPERIGPIETALIIEEKLIRLRSTTIDIDGTLVSLDGEVLLNRLAPEAYRFRIGIDGDTGLHITRSFGPIDVDGYGLGRLEITGDRSRIGISGTIRANGTSITLNDEFRRRERETDLVVDLDLETGRAVQFIWPDEDFPILRASFATGQTLSIESNSLTREFDLLGEAAIQSGDVFYFDRSFILRDGEVVFRENEERFDPRITVRAELREVTSDGPVRIYLVAENQALSEFSPTFESNPALTGTEIIAILGGNIFQQSDEAVVNLSTALLSTSDIVTQFGLFRSFENSVREQLKLDLFAIRTSLIQNALLTAIDPTDETTQQVSPSLGTYLNNTSIFMGRYLGDAVFGQVLLQLRSKDFTDEEQDEGIQELGGVLIDSEISLEWQTPFFLLEWTVAPQNPEELFVRDNTFSFLWSFRY